MTTKKWLRIIFFILGVVFIVYLLTMRNVNTKRIYVSQNSLIELDTQQKQLNLLVPDWQIKTTRDQKVYSTEILVSATQANSGIYMPYTKNVELFINNSTENILNDHSHFIYLITPQENNQRILIKIRTPIESTDEWSVVELYIGNIDSMLAASHRESNLRLFIVGLSFTIILLSLSLYVQKPNEKYLIPLALLAYSTLGYILLGAFPSLQENFWTTLLLLGSIKIPFLSNETSHLIYQLVFPLFVGLLNFFLFKNFVSVKIFKIDYFYYILVVALIMSFFIGDLRYAFLPQILRIFIHLLESIVIIKGDYVNKTDSIILLVGSIGTTALNIFLTGIIMNIIPHGDMDLLFRLGGVYASSYAIAFTIAVTGIFARKYAESEILSEELDNLNKNLQKVVDERTVSLKIAYESLEKEQQQKDIFTTNMVHSLKTPLFSIAGFADMAHEALQTMPDKAAHFIDLINTNADFVVKLVDNLFLALRLDNKKVTFMIEKTDLCKMMEQIYNITLPQAKNKKIHLSLKIPDSPLLIACDLYYLTLAIQNIADNAVRHTPNGGEIELALTDLEQAVQITVKDNGEGMADEVVQQIFERYYSYRNEGNASSGLGLSISKDVIAALHGQINVNSVIGKGTEFIISLPKELDLIDEVKPKNQQN